MQTIICHHCDLVSQKPTLATGYVAKCPRCGRIIHKNKAINANKLLALSITALLICIPAFTFPLLSIHLLGVTEETNLLQGAIMMIDIAPVVSFIVLFCAVVAPTLLTLCIAFSSACVVFKQRPTSLNSVLKLTNMLLHWSMLEVYLVSFMVAVFKLVSYADVYFNTGLYFFVALLILNMAMLSEYSNTKYWEYLHNE